MLPPKKNGWRVAAAFASLVALLAVAVWVAVIFIDSEALRERLAVKISSATGYQVELQTLDLSFYPVPGLRAGGLHARSESREVFAAESLFVEADLPSLLRRQIKIKKATLFKPVITLYLDRPEKKSSVSAQPTDSGPMPPLSLTIEQLSLNTDAPLNHLVNRDFSQKNVEVEVQAQNTLLKLGGYELSIPGMEAKGILRNGQFSQTVHGRFPEGNFLLNMTLQPGENPSGLQAFSLDSHLQFNGINPARLERSEAGNGIFSAGRVAGELRATGRSLKREDIRVDGTLNGENLLSGDGRYAVRRAVVNLQALNRNRGTVTFVLQGAKVDGVDLQKTTGNLVVSPGKIRLTRGRVFPEHGEVRVTGDYAMARQSYDARFSATGLHAGDVMKNKLTGQLQFTGRLQGRLTELAATRGLSGKVNVKLTDGTVPATNFIGSFLRLLNLHAVGDDGRPGLGYKYLGGDFHLAGGVLSTDNLRLDGGQLKLAAKGRVDLPTGRIDGKATAVPLLVDEVARTILLLGNLLATGEKGGDIETHFNVTGTLDNPKIIFDPTQSTVPAPEKIIEGIFNLPLLKGGK